MFSRQELHAAVQLLPAASGQLEDEQVVRSTHKGPLFVSRIAIRTLDPGEAGAVIQRAAVRAWRIGPFDRHVKVDRVDEGVRPDQSFLDLVPLPALVPSQRGGFPSFSFANE